LLIAATDKNAASVNAFIQALGGEVKVDTDNTSSYNRLFVGFRYNSFFSIEAFQFKTGGFTADATVDATRTEGVSKYGSIGGGSVSVTGNIAATATANASLRGAGVRINGHFPIPIFSNRFEMVVGIGVASITSVLTTRYDINGSVVVNSNVNVQNGGTAYTSPVAVSATGSETATINDSGFERSTERLIVPVLAIGIHTKLSKRFSVRNEFEIIGVPFNGLGVSTISSSIQYTF